jgi:hypothetical protein
MEGIIPPNLSLSNFCLPPFLTLFHYRVDLGLDLFVSQKPVHQYGSRIDVARQLGDGIILSVWMPAEDIAPTQALRL